MDEVTYYSRCERCRQAKNRTLSPLCGLCRQEVKRAARLTPRERALERATKDMTGDERAAVERLTSRVSLKDAVEFVRQELECNRSCCGRLTRKERLEAIQ